jgi:hypothetical protein
VPEFSRFDESDQCFADEVFRVWKASQSAIKLEVVSMSSLVAFLVFRATAA